MKLQSERRHIHNARRACMRLRRGHQIRHQLPCSHIIHYHTSAGIHNACPFASHFYHCPHALPPSLSFLGLPASLGAGI
jgi:hypothetical protein